MAKNTDKKKRSNGKKIGLALCSGGARGFAHVGVLQVLEKKGIFPDMIAGTSMGALIGALYSIGMKPKEIEKYVLSNEWAKNIEFQRPKSGLASGKRLLDYLKRLTDEKKFSDLDIPLVTVSTNINTGKKFVFKQGELSKAMYASMAIPGVFEPLQYRNARLVDGGLVNPLPIDELKEMGADIIIAVDLSLDTDELAIKKNKIYGIDRNSVFLEYMAKRIFESQKESIKRYIKSKSDKNKLPEFTKGPITSLVDMFFNSKKVLKNEYLDLAPEVIDVMSRSLFIMQNQIILEQLNKNKDVIIIRPKLDGISLIDAAPALKAIRAGRRATRKVLDDIDKCL